MSKTTRVLFAVVACAFVVTQAPAQDDNAPSVTVGGGLRAGVSLGSGSNGSVGSDLLGNPASGGDQLDSYGLNNVRLYVNASAYGWLGLEVNTESSAGNPQATLGATILDAVAKVKFSDSINLWTGRMLAPSDRANLSGPYYGNIGNGAPTGSRHYMNGNEQAGRDDGIAIWGNVGGDMNLKYQVGLFDGNEASNDEQMFAGRLVLNLWDDEPGYYNASTYYGEKEILAIGISYQSESAFDDDTDPTTPGLAGAGGGGFEDAMAIDILVEKSIEGLGTATLDLAWNDYSAAEATPALDPNGDADSVSVFVALLMDNEIALGPMSGKLRPYIQYITDGTNGDEYAIGIQHVINGHKASLCLEYRHWDGQGEGTGTPAAGAGGVAIPDADTDGSAVSLGLQFQF